MTPELEALARRAVACKKFRWMAGMRMLRPANEANRLPMRIIQSGARQSATNARIGDVGFIAAHEPPGAAWCGGYERDDIPDLADPCTLGGLLALVREAWGRPDIHAHTVARLGVWTVGCIGTPDALITVSGPTEAAALVAALEAAP